MLCGSISRKAVNMMVSDIKNTALELGLAQVRSNYTIPAGETFSITVEGDVPAISANEHGFCSITYIPIAAADYQKEIQISATRAAIAAGATEITWTAKESVTIPIGTYIVHAMG